MESQHFQEKVVRIRIKQSIWHCRAGIDSGLGRQDLHVFVGVLWVKLSADNEAGSFKWSATNNMDAGRTACFPQIFQPPRYYSHHPHRCDHAVARKTAHTQKAFMASEKTPWRVSSTCSFSSTKLHKKQYAINEGRLPQKSASFKSISIP